MLLGIERRRTAGALLPLEAAASDVCVRDPGHGSGHARRRQLPAQGNHPVHEMRTTFACSGSRSLEMRLFFAIFVALALPGAALAEPPTVKPDRAAIDRLLDEFIPAAVAQKDLQRGWELSAGASRTTTHAQWLAGNTSVQ